MASEKQLRFDKVRNIKISMKERGYEGSIAYEDMYFEGEQGRTRFVVIKKWKIDDDGVSTDKKQIYLPIALFEEFLKVYPKLNQPITA